MSGQREADLEECRAELANKEANMAKALNEEETLTVRLKTLRSEAEKIPQTLQDLEQHISYWQAHVKYQREKEGEAAQTRDRDELLGKIRGRTQDYQEMKKEFEKQHDKCVELQTTINNRKGQLHVIMEDLASSREVPRTMTEATIRLHAVNMSIADVHKYIQALEQSLLDYHTQKMEEINQSIHTLWQSIYRGNDIETISIKAEPGATENARYNYRVIMKKDGVDLDMANRCSAGQKMVASLIIRLALADTFAMNCGIIALDEPTTNLDGFNVDNLSEAINDLVEKRLTPGAKSFQLIVISHSNYFVDKLLKGGSIDHFYQIRRETDGTRHYSAIHRCGPQYLQLEGS
jgi:DNA repair protein RAD50